MLHRNVHGKHQPLLLKLLHLGAVAVNRQVMAAAHRLAFVGLRCHHQIQLRLKGPGGIGVKRHIAQVDVEEIVYYGLAVGGQRVLRREAHVNPRRAVKRVHRAAHLHFGRVGLRTGGFVGLAAEAGAGAHVVPLPVDPQPDGMIPELLCATLRDQILRGAKSDQIIALLVLLDFLHHFRVAVAVDHAEPPGVLCEFLQPDLRFVEAPGSAQTNDLEPPRIHCMNHRARAIRLVHQTPHRFHDRGVYACECRPVV